MAAGKTEEEMRGGPAEGTSVLSPFTLRPLRGANARPHPPAAKQNSQFVT